MILVAFVALALIYARATPPLEASDELWHVGMVDALADTGSLPVQVPGVETAWEQEGSQPPLYYLLAAGLVAGIDRDDFDALRQPNPHARAGVPGASDNKNLVLHDTPHPSLQGAALAVYVLRCLGILLSCVTVAAVYFTAGELSPNPIVAALAAGLTALNPMFLFISASVNNDNLVTALNSLILWQTLVMLRQGFSTRRSFALAALLALASLSKLSALVLIPVVGLAALWVASRSRDGRGFTCLILLIAVAWAGLAGWWYLRNVTLYGELFGTRAMVAVAGPRTDGFTLQTLIDEFEGFRVGYWGWFGAVNITAAPLYYRVMDAVVVIALAGLALYGWQARRQAQMLVRIGLLALVIALGSVALIGWTAQTYASQGRLLFPYLAAISPLLALGLERVFRVVRLPEWILISVGIGAFGIWALLVPFTTIAPHYALPEPRAELPPNAQPVYARFDRVELVGYEATDTRYEPGDAAPITVYWRVVEQTERDLSLYLHAVNDDGEVIGRIDSYPGGGRLRTTTWLPGMIYADSYRILLDDDASGASRLRVQVGWWDFESGDVVQPTSENDTPLESVMLDAGGFAGVEPIPTDLTDISDVNFGGVIALDGYRIAQDQVVLSWRAMGAPDANYTVFVQALDDQNVVAAQGDAPPALPTRYWQPGDRFVTRHPLISAEPLPPGSYRMVIGWYKPEDGARLETASPDNAYPLGTLTVP